MNKLKCAPDTDTCGASVNLSLTWIDSDGNQRQEFSDNMQGLSNTQALVLYYEHRARLAELYAEIKPSDDVDVTAIAAKSIGE